MMTTNQRRLAALILIASPSDRHDGLHWYDDARRFATETATQFELPVNVVAGVIAVLSPRQGWKRNKDLAYTVCEMYSQGFEMPSESDLGCFRANIVKAWGLLTEYHNEGFDPFLYVRGPKVTAFYRNILGDSNVITLDTHALHAWFGNTERKGQFSAKEKAQASDDYATVAKQCGITPSQAQAIVWVVWRSLIMSQAQLDVLG
jgi:hypothetical protein